MPPGGGDLHWNVLCALSADFRSAGFDLLERLTLVTPETMGRFVAKRADVSGAVLLSTCNRFEAYLDVPAAAARDEVVGDLLTAVAGASGLESYAIGSMLVERVGEDVAAHLFSVSSGLESLVLGEVEIAGQVSRALEVARAAGTTTPELERLFQRASRTSSAVQHRTRLGGAGRSVVRLALDLVESRIGAWADASVLLIGTGSYAGATLAALRDRGVREVAVYSPSNRAARFARREGVVAVPTEDLPARLTAATLVIACSIATTPVVDAARLLAGRAAGAPAHRQMVIDLGLPRNVDPDVAGVEGVDLLDLETIGLHAPLPELQATTEAQALVGQALAEYRAAQQADAVTPAVVAYRGHVSELVDQEITRLRRRGESSEAAERALRHLASVLVHAPSARAREAAAHGEAVEFVGALQRVFGLEVAAPPGIQDDEDEAVRPAG